MWKRPKDEQEEERACYKTYLLVSCSCIDHDYKIGNYTGLRLMLNKKVLPLAEGLIRPGG